MTKDSENEEISFLEQVIKLTKRLDQRMEQLEAKMDKGNNNNPFTFPLVWPTGHMTQNPQAHEEVSNHASASVGLQRSSPP